MNWSKLKADIQRTHWPIFILAFVLGWATYSLKLVSIVKLLGELSFDMYPPLMLVQGVVLYAVLKLFKKISSKSSAVFSVIALASSLVVIVSAKLIPYSHWSITCAYFLMSTICVLAIDILFKIITTQNVSILKNPKINSQILFVYELGIILGAALTLKAGHTSFFEIMLWSSPFIVSLGLIPFFKHEKEKTKIADNVVKLSDYKKENKTKHSVFQKYPFTKLIIGLTSVVLILKQFQGFAMLLGMSSLAEQGSLQISEIFSKLSLVQTSLILASMLPSFFVKKSNMTWGKGYKVFLGQQSLSMLALSIIPNPLVMVGTGMLRKLTHHSLLNQSMSLLDANIPEKIRFEIKSRVAMVGHTSSYLFLAAGSALIIYDVVPTFMIWSFVSLIGIAGIFLQRRLFTALGSFQVSNIIQSNVYEAVNACHSLANKENDHHHMALENILKQQPRPILTKSIVYTLGEMKHKESISSIINTFKSNDREDIQLVSVHALLNYKSHDINLFFRNVLQDLITEQTRLGQIRTPIFKAISHHIPDVATLTLLDLLQKHKDDFRIIANVVEVLGYIAKTNNDSELFSTLATYTCEEYPRRIRTNILGQLYYSKEHKATVVAHIESLMASQDEYDKSAACYLIGVLGLKDMISFTIGLSQLSNNQNSTVLVSLLRLNYQPAIRYFNELIISSDEDIAMTALNQLSTVKNQKIRNQIYFDLLTEFPTHVSRFNELLRNTKRNFDQDRALIITEAKRLGIDLTQDYRLFVDKKNLKKVA